MSEDAEVGHSVGSVTATAHDGGAVTYAIIAGNDNGDFALGADGGLTTVTLLDHETGGTYALTIEAVGANGAAASVTVAVEEKAGSLELGGGYHTSAARAFVTDLTPIRARALASVLEMMAAAIEREPTDEA